MPLVSALSLAVSVTTASPGMIAPLWRGVDRIVVECAASARRVCATAIADVARDAPWPVVHGARALSRGDAILRLRIVDRTLFVSVERGVVVDESEGPLAARPVALTTLDDAAAVATALDSALPWRRPMRLSQRSRRS